MSRLRRLFGPIARAVTPRRKATEKSAGDDRRPEPANHSPYNDQPISEPSADRFRIDPFAKALADSIRRLPAPNGTVIALNGPWGSGKSSAVNLIKFHLKDSVEAGEIAIIDFACWWFRGEEALALAFFRELYAGLGPSLSDKFRDLIPQLGVKLLRAGSLVGAGIELTGAVGVGAVASGGMNWLSELISKSGEPVEKLYKQLTAALLDQKRRFVIVIDDIDRLSPDEALLIFRLVKSVGRLPNIIYLLVFDRKLAEAIVEKQFPSEGPHYLEKIIQVAFDLPPITPEHLHRQVLDQVLSVCGPPDESEVTRFMNIFYDVVAPLVKTPRDLNRLMNTLNVTWAAIGAELDSADFIGVEALRLLKPDTYRRIRANKDRLCGKARSGRSPAEQGEVDHLLLGDLQGMERDKQRSVLMRLFPPLGSVWSNLVFGTDSKQDWERKRLVCSEVYFDAYFQFTLGDDAISVAEIGDLLAHSGDETFVSEKFRDALRVVRTDGTTKASLLLEQLNLYANDIPEPAILPLFKALFRLADVLDVDEDRAKGFAFGDNPLRLRVLVRRVVERLDPTSRSKIILDAYEASTLGWAVDFGEYVHREHFPRDGKARDPSRPYLTTEADAITLRQRALLRLRAAASTDELISHPQLVNLLFRWRDIAEDDGAEIKAWTKSQLERQASVVKLAKTLTLHSWVHTFGDVVSQRKVRAHTQGLDEIMDKEAFRARLEELASGGTLDSISKEIVSIFLDAWPKKSVDQ